MRKIASLVLFSLAASCGGTSAPVVVNGVTGTAGNSLASAPTIAPVAVDTAADASFGALLNAVRAKETGVAPVVYNAQLNAAAQAHADDMLDNDATLAGYDWRTYGENIASGYRSETGVMTGWTNSPGHHANNINPNFTEFGLGLAQDGGDTRWVLMLGAR